MDTPQKKATVNTADWHFGDKVQLPRSWRACHERALEQYVAPFEPDVIEFVVNGDAVAGKGIFRSQANRVILQTPEHQALLAAWEFAPLVRLAEQIAPVRVSVLWGNHDDADLSDLARKFVEFLALLGVRATYLHTEYVGSLSATPREDAVFQAAHGFGHSDYYPISYSGIRDLWRLHGEIAQLHGAHVRRFMRAHTHFMGIGLPVLLDCFVDIPGGWHAQTRWNLGKSIRNTGLIVYRDDGRETEVVPVYADTALLVEETKDLHLPDRNRARAAEALPEAREYMEYILASVAGEAAKGWQQWLREKLRRGS
jgi:hypothetical protein